MTEYRRVSSLKTAAEIRSHVASLGVSIPLDEQLQAAPDNPLAQPSMVDGFTIGNRFCILPMEGWDGTTDGRPSDLTIRRWRRFGQSGAKLIWGGEAVAVCHDGRANPNQLLISEAALGSFASLRETLVAEHQQHFGRADDLLIGLQLTHSGRFSKPNDNNRPEPRILYHHPLLDRKFGLATDHPILSDDDIARLVDDFIQAARLAQRAGFGYVDIKHCHGYLGHEFLSAVDRPSRYGGSFENRTRFLREVVAGIRAKAPGLHIGVRVSAADCVPFPITHHSPLTTHYRYAFGGDGTGLGIDLTEPRAFLNLLSLLNIHLVCISLGAPYYSPHFERPALFPPLGGYSPPEDPLVGVARHIAVTAALKRHAPQLTIVGSGYSYLQEWLPHVAQAVIRRGDADFIGLGRMVLAYPELPADVLAGRPIQRKRLCRTFSDCTTAPRNGLPSGCYPLDEFYKGREEGERLREIKQASPR